MPEFNELVNGGNSDGIADHVQIKTHHVFEWIYVITDDHEGVACMNIETAEKMIPVLQKAVAHLKEQRAESR